MASHVIVVLFALVRKYPRADFRIRNRRRSARVPSSRSRRRAIVRAFPTRPPNHSMKGDRCATAASEPRSRIESITRPVLAESAS